VLRKVSVFSNIAFILRTVLKIKLAVGQMLRFLSFVGNRSDVCFVLFVQKCSVDHNVVMFCGVYFLLLEHNIQFVVLVHIVIIRL